MRLSGQPRPAWWPPGCVCKRGRAGFPRFAPRAGSRACLSRSWRSGCTERASGGHEHRCAGLRRPPHRSCRNGLPLWHGSQQAIDAPVAMQSAARSAWVARSSGLLAVAAHSAFAASLLELSATSEGKRPSCTKSLLTCAGSSPSLQAG